MFTDTSSSLWRTDAVLQLRSALVQMFRQRDYSEWRKFDKLVWEVQYIWEDEIAGSFKEQNCFVSGSCIHYVLLLNHEGISDEGYYGLEIHR